MKYFYTFVTETLTRPVVVKAENQEEAEQKVETIQKEKEVLEQEKIDLEKKLEELNQ